jgi:hypothetical protein
MLKRRSSALRWIDESDIRKVCAVLLRPALKTDYSESHCIGIHDQHLIAAFEIVSMSRLKASIRQLSTLSSLSNMQERPSFQQLRGIENSQIVQEMEQPDL